MNIFDQITAPNIEFYWNNIRANQTNYMGETLFPVKRIQGLELSKIGGRAGLPVQLVASAFDTQATYRDRLGLEVTKQKMPFFRERMKVDEETRQKLLMINAAAFLEDLIPYVFDDIGNLIRGALVSRERMAMELISTGKVFVKNQNGVNMEYDYGLSKDQKVKPTVKWSDKANANPIQDIIDWVDDFRTKFGVNLEYIVMTTKTFNMIKACDSTKSVIYPIAVNVGNQLLTSAQVKDAINQNTGVRVLINDNVYATSVGGHGVKFFPDGVVSFLPTGAVLGNMFVGTTPEEIDLKTNPKYAADTVVLDNGVTIFTMTVPHPVNVETIVSQICLPSFGSDVDGGAGSILIANVA